MPKTPLKIEPFLGSVTDISSKDLKLYQKQTPAQAPTWPFIIKVSFLWERPQALLKIDSVTDSVTVIYIKRPEALLKIDSTTDLN